MQLVLRFDVDTPRCVRRGMQELNKLSSEFDVPFVFFVNFGRAVNLSVSLFRRDSGTATAHAEKLGLFEKQRFIDVAELMTRNPRLIDIGAEQITRANGLGSEIGVHGGSNHGSWQWSYHSWDEEKIEAEVDWGTRAFEQVLKKRPVGFSSPGWATDERLPTILAASGYKYLADLHGTGDHNADAEIPNFATVLSGEPGGVGYFEHCVARGLSARDMLAEVETAASDSTAPVILYDHPCFAGFGGRHLLRALLEHARASGWSVRTLADLVSAE